MSFIQLTHIDFSYPGEEEPVLSDLSLTLEAGGCLWVKGDNGVGKSTLFRILNGLSFPDRGEYFFDGVQITQRYLDNNTNAKRFHKRIGYLFQNPDVMLFNGTVYNEIAFGPRQMGLSEEETAARVNDCMELFSIANLSQKAPYHLSGGQKKRVALAAVMALNPEVLILDEPLGGLDKKSADSLMAFLRDMKRAGKTIILASHEDAAVEELCDRTIVLM